MTVTITKEIQNCEECPHSETSKVYTSDSWDNVRKVYCKQLDKVVLGYLDWYDKSTVPSVCPFKKPEEKIKAYRFDNGERFWIIAKKEKDAIEYFINVCDGDANNESYEMKELLDEELDELIIDNSECDKDNKYYNYKFVSINHILEELDEKQELPRQIACSVY